ncbi:reverse transcriptase domain-containing protein [Tanacetum coccineum]
MYLTHHHKFFYFPFSLDGVPKNVLDKVPPNSILTWDDLVSSHHFFLSPSMTTKILGNELTNFVKKNCSRSSPKLWERFKELLRKCPHHGFSLMHQLDTFYNSLSYNDQDSLNSAAGGNFLYKSPTEGLQIIENKAKVRCSRNAVNATALEDKMTLTFRNEMNEMKNMMKALVPTPVPIKAVGGKGLPALQSTRMTLELANCSLCVPKGIARDVLVPVGRLTFPADFVVVDFECDYRVPLILGRPFLRTARVLIDVHGEELVIRGWTFSNLFLEKKMIFPLESDDSILKEEVKKETLKSYSNPLFEDDEEIISIEVSRQISPKVNSEPSIESLLKDDFDNDDDLFEMDSKQ